MGIAEHLRTAFGTTAGVAIEAYDGSRAGPGDASATISVRSPNAIRRLLTAPGELGLARAYVAGDVDIDGDIFTVVAMGSRVHPDDGGDRLGQGRSLRGVVSARTVLGMLGTVGPTALRPLGAPPEEVHLRGRRHSRARDAAAIAHHYDVSNDFYRIVLGPTMTYSCAVWGSPTVGLDAAQAAKHELICQKLSLTPGMRLLDVGCGWGSMVIHAAREHGVRAVGVTISGAQAELAAKRVIDAGVADQVEIRLQDYRDVDDGPYDAISSIGMFEHVGLARLKEYFSRLYELVRPGRLVLNHGISRPTAGPPSRFGRRTFINRYVFPDGELHEVGSVVTTMHACGLEVRHLETLREHYGLTLRAWVRNLEARWDEAVSLVGSARARVWRLYMAASAVGFEQNRLQVHQVLAVTGGPCGASGLALRPKFG
jgi:cyclopropane-fatty-acyl-phospholipid synthase